MNKKIIIILYFHLFAVEIMAQQYVFNITSAASYCDNYFTSDALNSAVIKTTDKPLKFYDARMGFKLGVVVNRNIYKNIGLNLEAGYALGGFRLPKNGYNNINIFNVHQLYAVLAPQIKFFKHLNIAIGGFSSANLFYTQYTGSQKITEKVNFGSVIKLSYQVDKFNIGMRYFNYKTPFYKNGDIKEYWKIYDFVLSYRLFNF